MAIVSATAMRRAVFAMTPTGLAAVATSDMTLSIPAAGLRLAPGGRAERHERPTRKNRPATSAGTKSSEPSCSNRSLSGRKHCSRLFISEPSSFSIQWHLDGDVAEHGAKDERGIQEDQAGAKTWGGLVNFESLDLEQQGHRTRGQLIVRDPCRLAQWYLVEGVTSSGGQEVLLEQKIRVGLGVHR